MIGTVPLTPGVGGTTTPDFSRMSVGISAFPLSQGRDTGRGIERVFSELVSGLEATGQPHTFYDRGIIRNELVAMAKGASYLWELRGQEHDLWFGAYSVAGIFPILAGKRPVVTGVYDLIPFFAPGYDNAVKYAIKRRCIAFSCRHSDGLIVPFSSTATDIVEMFGVPAERIGVIPLGVDRKRFFRDTTIAKRSLRIGFLGEAKRAKGLDIAIRAFAQVVRTLPGAYFTIAGGGNEIDAMKELARKEIPEGRYEFVGFVPEADMRQFYSQLDLFVFPSRYGFGMSPVEAMACGTPAIVARTLDASEFFDNGLSIVEADPESLAKRVILLATDRDRYRELQNWGLARVEQLSWERMAARYVEFWQRTRALWTASGQSK